MVMCLCDNIEGDRETDSFTSIAMWSKDLFLGLYNGLIYEERKITFYIWNP